MTSSEIIIGISSFFGALFLAIIKDLLAVKKKKDENMQRITEEEIKRKYKKEEELHLLIFKMQEQHSENLTKIMEIVPKKYQPNDNYLNEIANAVLIKNNSRFDYLTEIYYPTVSTKYKEIVNVSADLIKYITDHKIAKKDFSLEEASKIFARYNHIGSMLNILKQEFVEISRNNRIKFLNKNTKLIE